jgi:uncharacterized membrane protein YfcA
MTLTMVFGSFIAGSTSEGGAAVAFPVLTLLFKVKVRHGTTHLHPSTFVSSCLASKCKAQGIPFDVYLLCVSI